MNLLETEFVLPHAGYYYSINCFVLFITLSTIALAITGVFEGGEALATSELGH